MPPKRQKSELDKRSRRCPEPCNYLFKDDSPVCRKCDLVRPRKKNGDFVSDEEDLLPYDSDRMLESGQVVVMKNGKLSPH